MKATRVKREPAAESGGLARRKGIALEDLVAEMHSFGDLRVEKRVSLKAREHGEPREIDVLVSGALAGYPARIAFECKNETKKVGIEKIDAFAGKLDDVGIPRAMGVYVSSRGFTKGAKKRAAKEGIRTLLLEGLDQPRLSAAVGTALQSVVLLSAEISQISAFASDEPAPARIPSNWIDAGFRGNVGVGIPALYTLIWLLWRDGRIPKVLGEHYVRLRLPDGFRLGKDNLPSRFPEAIATIRVRGHVHTSEGESTTVTLRDAASGAIEKLRIEAKWPLPGPSKLQTFETETELEQKLAAPLLPHLWTRIPLPRVIGSSSYWPPSEQAIRKGIELQRAGRKPSFEEIEGSSLDRAWEKFLTAPEVATLSLKLRSTGSRPGGDA